MAGICSDSYWGNSVFIGEHWGRRWRCGFQNLGDETNSSAPCIFHSLCLLWWLIELLIQVCFKFIVKGSGFRKHNWIKPTLKKPKQICHVKQYQGCLGVTMQAYRLLLCKMLADVNNPISLEDLYQNSFASLDMFSAFTCCHYCDQ